MRHGSLFSGIGGFDLAAEWMGWENVFHCEINEFCNKILNHYWPDAKSYTDIKQTDFNIWRGKVDIITGGFPCQPYSAAGKRKGKEDDRHLWPFMLAAIKQIQPRWIVGENVSGLLNWNRGMVLDEIKADLEAAGFEVLPPLVLPACAVNAPHRRDRVWIVAHSNGKHSNVSIQQRGQDKAENIDINREDERRIITDTNNQGLQRSKVNGSIGKIRANRNEQLAGCVPQKWDKFPTEPPICSRNDGLSGELVGITVSKHRTESIKAYGNSVVPQVVYELFKTIEQYEQTKLFP